jgi:hypothetical protein
MSGIGWHGQLDDASTVHDVVEIARDFLASWDRHEIASLPEACRPGKLFDANDVTSYAFQLVQHDCGSDADAAPLVHKMAGFFSYASIRLSKVLAGEREAGEGEVRESA